MKIQLQKRVDNFSQPKLIKISIFSIATMVEQNRPVLWKSYQFEIWNFIYVKRNLIFLEYQDFGARIKSYIVISGSLPETNCCHLKPCNLKKRKRWTGKMSLKVEQTSNLEDLWIFMNHQKSNAIKTKP